MGGTNNANKVGLNPAQLSQDFKQLQRDFNQIQDAFGKLDGSKSSILIFTADTGQAFEDIIKTCGDIKNAIPFSQLRGAQRFLNKVVNCLNYFEKLGITAVSYTHLDVYKRQMWFLKS